MGAGTQGCDHCQASLGSRLPADCGVKEGGWRRTPEQGWGTSLETQLCPAAACACSMRRSLYALTSATRAVMVTAAATRPATRGRAPIYTPTWLSLVTRTCIFHVLTVFKVQRAAWCWGAPSWRPCATASSAHGRQSRPCPQVHLLENMVNIARSRRHKQPPRSNRPGQGLLYTQEVGCT